METLEQIAIDNGFESYSEFHSLVASCKIDTVVKNVRFRSWQYEDGTKEGLLKVIEQNK